MWPPLSLGIAAVAVPAEMPATAVVNTAILVDGKPARIPAPANAAGRPSAMYPPSLQDNDWSALREGDPMFIHQVRQHLFVRSSGFPGSCYAASHAFA